MSAPGAGGETPLFQSAIAPGGVREIQASRRSEPGERVSGCADTLQVGARRMHVELGLGDNNVLPGPLIHH
jgi:hypothetical protein